MDDILYDIGLSITSTTDEPKKRDFLCNPSVVFTLSFLSLLQKLLIIVSDDEIILLVVCGDITHYYGFTTKVILAVYVSLELSLTMSSQLIYYYNHKWGIKPTFLGVFRKIIEGNVGIDQVDIAMYDTLGKTLKKLVSFMKINVKLIYMVGIVYNVSANWLQGHTLINTVWFSFWGIISINLVLKIVFNSLGYQIMYFYILCKYFRMKLKNLENSIPKKNVRKRFIKLDRILLKYDDVYREIQEYNATYWSKILCAIWLTFGPALVLFISSFIIEIPLLCKATIIYVALVYTFIFLVTIMSAASVNYKAHDCYQSLNSFFILPSNFKTKVSRTTYLRNKLKVFMIIELINIL